MKIKFAPLNLPLRRRLQTVAVLQWIFSFLVLAQICAAIFVVLLLSRYWWIPALYACWLFLDWETPRRGGRRVEFARHWRIWNLFRDYFPVHLVKTVDLPPNKNYLFCFHPHGVLVAGGFCNFGTEATGFSKIFPGLRPHLLMLPLWFRVPFFRDYLMCGGLVPSDKQTATWVLSRPGGGNVAVLAIGGAPESLDAQPGRHTLQVLNRKGFIKLVLKVGATLVPVYSFGENNLFEQVPNPHGSLLRRVQDRLQSFMGVAMPLFHARGVFQYSFGLLPYRKPIYTVVGHPILVPQVANPSAEQIESLHSRYLTELKALFEENKEHYGLSPDEHLNLT
uniref:2-acylglycerol O-acyltransferase 2-A-like n=1 Tax=Myxine glutinosa TaxID=7769 RepID=UPI0035900FEB